MGGTNSLLTAEQIAEYADSTHLTRAEVIDLFSKFEKLGPNELVHNIHERFPSDKVAELFPELQFNPFRDRIFKIFSSKKDNAFSFEDMLDLCSAMSSDCPTELKGLWAFKMFDFDEDGELSQDDLRELIDRLVGSETLTEIEKSTLTEMVLDEIEMQYTGHITQLEFLLAIPRMPELAKVFSFKI